MPVEHTPPAKRGPGRPRKTEEKAEPNPEAKSKFPADERVGQSVDNPAWTGITFPDDREYRVENGVIVERIR